ncbi:PAS domain-containing protein [Paenibacillus sp. 3LSP]|uniref:PAS domain-containing protein n=1 Tax=Paenibacillus sp. 3LSP TaxID=2800795 RepID=UPI0028FD4E13|nr:PAS domain-containing protein [Paenibacillus sp. 3LSP]MDU0330516.1 PAS domain-containing protein [Paenibacillus sp. 3LSP]
MSDNLQWKAPYHSLNQSVAIIEPNGTIVSVNRTWAKRAASLGVAHGWARPGLNIFQFFQQGPHHHRYFNPHLLMEQFSKILSGETDLIEIEFKVSSNDDELWFLAELTPYAEEDASSPQGIVITCTNITRIKRLQLQIQHELAHTRTLRGLLPICAVCKKIKDEGNNRWCNTEAYLIQHTHAEFTHDICPDCIRALYPKYSSNLDLPPQQEP